MNVSFPDRPELRNGDSLVLGADGKNYVQRADGTREPVRVRYEVTVEEAVRATDDATPTRRTGVSVADGVKVRGG